MLIPDKFILTGSSKKLDFVAVCRGLSMLPQQQTAPTKIVLTETAVTKD